MVVPPALALVLPYVHVVPALGVEAIARPVGRVSVSATPEISTEDPFVTVIVSLLDTPGFLVAFVKVFDTVGVVTTFSTALVAIVFEIA
jgi:hypothetical protein